MSRRTNFAAFVFITPLFVGCTDDDEIWLPPSGTGKADGVAMLKGSDVPSQYVDANKYYLTGRKITSLQEVNALTGVAHSVAIRADGIIANLPANGRIEAAELVRLENPAIFATLFPDEQAALPTLWPHLVAPGPSATMVGAAVHDPTVTERLTEPGGLTPPASIAISTLPTDLQTVAKRVQLVFNADGIATTIQIADIDQVLANPSAFTPAEVLQLGTIKGVFHARAVSYEEAALIVPQPGEKFTSTTLGPLKLEYRSTITIRELRLLVSSSAGANDWRVTLRIESKLEATLRANNSGNDVVAIDLGTGAEYVFHGAENALPELSAGGFVFESYASGQRQSSHHAALPVFKPGDTVTDLSRFADYSILLANNMPLMRNATRTAEMPYNGAWISDVEFQHQVSPFTTPGVIATIVDAVGTPPITLPTGRYEIPTPGYGTVFIDLYARGVMIVRYGGPSYRLRYDTWEREKAMRVNASGRNFVFRPSTNELTVYDANASSRVTVTPAYRTK